MRNNLEHCLETGLSSMRESAKIICKDINSAWDNACQAFASKTNVFLSGHDTASLHSNLVAGHFEYTLDLCRIAPLRESCFCQWVYRHEAVTPTSLAFH